MILKQYTLGTNRSNSYIVGCKETKEGMVIDPGFDRHAEAEWFIEKIHQSGLKIRYILNTHGHTDHMAGNGIVKRATGALILIHEFDAPRLLDIPERWLKRVEFDLSEPPPADVMLHEGDIVQVGKLEFRIIHTPGHSMGSVSLLCEDSVFTGDALFEGAIGITDIPGASLEELMNSIRSKLLKLPDFLRIYPGHGDTSTIGEEKRSNPFLREDLGETPEQRMQKIGEFLSAFTSEAIMTPIDKDTQTCHVDEKVEDIREQLESLRREVKIMAVVDYEMKLVGIIMPTDIFRARPEEKIVGDIMEKNTLAIHLDEKADVAWRTLRNHRYVPIIDRSNIVKGFIQRKTVFKMI
ncbi:MAG: MBL fold metallo-hydrolase [Candidatus Bathyarchaeota archaeon]